MSFFLNYHHIAQSSQRNLTAMGNHQLSMRLLKAVPCSRILFRHLSPYRCCSHSAQPPPLARRISSASPALPSRQGSRSRPPSKQVSKKSRPPSRHGPSHVRRPYMVQVTSMITLLAVFHARLYSSPSRNHSCLIFFLWSRVCALVCVRTT